MSSGESAPYPRLLGDVGGTHIRFGWLAGPGAGIAATQVYRWADVAGIEAAATRYLAERGYPAPRACALSVAGPVHGDEVALTNHGWAFSVPDLRRRLGLERLDVLNDFAALALAIPKLGPGDAVQIGGGASDPAGAIAIVGAGTGLGVSASVVLSAGRHALSSEGGHASLSSSDATEDRLLSILRQWFGHVSFERVLSGQGIVNLYRAHCAMAGVEAAPHEPAAISHLAAQALDACCVAAMDRFFAFLGSFAGNMALTFDARGGVYLAGGIVPPLRERLEASGFRQRFEGKGRFRAYLESIATKLIVDPTAAALLGANQSLGDR